MGRGSRSSSSVAPAARRRRPAAPASLAGVFDGVTVAGARLTVTDARSAGCDGDIEREGVKVGEFAWGFDDEPDGGAATLAHVLTLPSAHRSGFGRAFEAHAARALAQRGVRRIRLHATQVGAYLWATAGYAFDSDPAIAGAKLADDAYWRLHDLYRGGHASPREIAELTDALRAGALRPAQIADWGRELAWTAPAGTVTWLGRELLLDNSWHGVKELCDVRRVMAGAPVSSSSAAAR